MNKSALLLMIPLFLAPLGADDFSDWRKREAQAFEGYRAREEQAFRDYLSREWEEFEAFKANRLYEEPKYPRQPVVNSTNQTSSSVQPSARWAQGNTRRPEANRFLDYSIRGLPSMVLEIYDISIRFPRPEQRLPVLERPGARGVAEYYERMSALDIAPLITALQQADSQLNLGDWGFAQLAYTYAETEIGPAREDAYPLTWYLLLQAGFDARLALDGTSGGMFLLLSVRDKLYNMPYAQIEGNTYYFVDFSPEKQSPIRFFTYPQGHPGAIRPLTISFSALPTLPVSDQNRNLIFTFDGIQHDLRLEYAGGVIDYYRNYPQADFGAYFSGGTSHTFSASVAAALNPLLSSHSEAEAVNLLLRFVQTALAYRTDQDQFAREKWMLPEETIHYPYSDCDDRAILFGWLVKELLGLPVIGVNWPGHMATAVAFTNPEGGASFTYRGSRWTICDPTYLGADLGMVMPAYSGKSFSIIEPKPE